VHRIAKLQEHTSDNCGAGLNTVEQISSKQNYAKKQAEVKTLLLQENIPCI
jgi:hypothetical protein